MNYSKKQTDLALRRLAKQVGRFIRYWGFRQIHGEIWTVVYLSQQPRSGVEIGRVLGVSKALISPALKQLKREGLLQSVDSLNGREKRYQAIDDVEAVIRGVLRRREHPLLEGIYQSFVGVEARPGNDLNSQRAERLGAMVRAARDTLGVLLEDLPWN